MLSRERKGLRFNKLITCKSWCFRQGATLLWPLIFARLFRLLEDWFGKSEEGVPVRGVRFCKVQDMAKR